MPPRFMMSGPRRSALSILEHDFRAKVPRRSIDWSCLEFNLTWIEEEIEDRYPGWHLDDISYEVFLASEDFEASRDWREYCERVG